MTLTAILPSLRASLPDPLDPVLWPAHTETTIDDVRVTAVSMVRLAEIAGTPCVHTAEEAPPRWRPRDWSPRDVSVAVATVTSVRRPRGVLVLGLDAVLPACAVLDQVRLIGRTSTAPLTAAAVVRGPDGAAEGPFRTLPAPLPSDVRVGDLVCFPCRAALTHRDVVTGATSAPVRAEVLPAAVAVTEPATATAPDAPVPATHAAPRTIAAVAR